MLVEITEAGMRHWDTNRGKTEVGEQISVGGSEGQEEQELFVLGLLYGSGPDDPSDFINQNPGKWNPIIDSLKRKGYIGDVKEEEFQEEEL